VNDRTRVRDYSQVRDYTHARPAIDHASDAANAFGKSGRQARKFGSPVNTWGVCKSQYGP